jgi:glycerophosphoryl diester phosphodiesterase
VPLVIAHRGASAAAPENTVEAFRLARERGADWVELDARRTADGAVVVHHDAELPSGEVIVERRRDQLPAHVPDLAVALDACEGMGVNIEIKNVPKDPDHDPGEVVAAMVVRLVQERQAHDRVLVSSFSLATIERVQELDPTIPTAYLVMAIPPDLGLVAHHGALHPWDPMVDRALVELAHRAGMAVNVWTVDDPARMAELASWGVDGIVTNVPDVAREVLAKG